MKNEAIKTMIELAMTSGSVHPIPPLIARRLGFGEANVRRKSLRYSTLATPEKNEHMFAVVLDKEPVGAVLAVGGSKEKGAALTFFKTSMDGTLERAFHCRGDVGNEDAVVVELELDAKATRDEFERELAFYQEEAPKLERESEKEEREKRVPRADELP